jgi:UDP-glucose 4-epimerase
LSTAVVSGAYGFVGRHVACALAHSGYSVTGIGHGSWGLDEWRRWGLEAWHNADVTLETLVTYAGTPDVIVHCAGSGSVGYSMSHPRQDFDRTVGTSLAVFDFLRIHAPAARLVVPSSAGVYGLAETMPIPIDAPLNPVSPYGVNKKIVEDLGRSYARHFGLNIAVVRLFSIYGIGLRKQLLWDASTKLSRGDSIFAGTGEETRDWLHVEDAAAILLAAASVADPSCPIVNGGTGIATDNRRVLEMLAAHIAPRQTVRFSGQTRAGDPQHYQADITTAKSLGWAPTHQLPEEVAAYGAWYRRGAP